MRKFLTAVVVIPLVVIAIVFAVANRHDVTVSFDPFNSADPALSSGPIPLFVLIIAVAAFGVLVGGCATWIGQRHWRRAARQHQADAQSVRAEFTAYKAATLAAQGTPQRLAAPLALSGSYKRDKQGAAL